MTEGRGVPVAALIGAGGVVLAAVITASFPLLRDRFGHEGKMAERATLPAPDKPGGPPAAASGLKGEYWNLPPFDRDPPSFSGPPQLSRIDPTVDFSWAEGVPAPTISADYFGVRWTGQIHAPLTGTYMFQLTHSDGARLLVNDSPVFEFWHRGSLHRQTGNVYLEGDQWYPFRLEMFHSERRAEIHLLWRRPGADIQLIPSGVLRSGTP